MIQAEQKFDFLKELVSTIPDVQPEDSPGWCKNHRSAFPLASAGLYENTRVFFLFLSILIRNYIVLIAFTRMKRTVSYLLSMHFSCLLLF